MFIYPSERIISVLVVIFQSSSLNLLSKYLLPLLYVFHIYALTWHLFVIKIKRIVIADKRIIFDIYLVGICLAPVQIRKNIDSIHFWRPPTACWVIFIIYNAFIFEYYHNVVFVSCNQATTSTLLYKKNPGSSHQYNDHKQIYAKYKNDFRWFVSLKYDSSSFSISEAMASKIQNYHWAW